jgi:hypothetical protein
VPRSRVHDHAVWTGQPAVDQVQGSSSTA